MCYDLQDLPFGAGFEQSSVRASSLKPDLLMERGAYTKTDRKNGKVLHSDTSVKPIADQTADRCGPTRVCVKR